MRYPYVLFDLDGTLIDSGPIILASMQHAVKAVLGREMPAEEFAASVGGQGLIAQMRALDASRVDELMAAYSAHNDPLHDTLEAFDGLVHVLPRLRDEGRKLGIVTSKRHRTVALALERFPWLSEYFDAVVAYDDTERHKPDPDPVLAGIERLGGEPSTSAYVGDSPFDIEAAKAAGAYAVGVTWGGLHGSDRLREAEPDALVDDPEELLGVL